MLRGCQKKVFYMKNPNGVYFDEVYFILKKGLPDPSGQSFSSDLAAEADRIIREAGGMFASSARRRKVRTVLSRAAVFALGAAASSALIGTVALILLYA